MLSVLVSLCVVIILFVYIYWSKRIERNDGVRTLPCRLPLLGHCLTMARAKDIFSGMIQVGNLTIEMGNVSKAFFGFHTIYVITDPYDGFTVLNKCLQKMFLYGLIEPIFGKAIIAAEVPVWKRNKRILDTVFKRNNLNRYLGFFNEQANRLVNVLQHQVTDDFVDLKDIITWNVLETTLQTTMGKVNNEDVISKEYAGAIHSLLRMIIQRAIRPWLYFDFIFKASIYGKEYNRCLQIVQSQSERLICLRNEEYIRRMKSEEEFHYKDSDFQSLLEILLENNKGMDGDMYTRKELRHLLDNVLLAAYDTTSYELLFIMLCIGSHREVQEKLFEEINQVVGNGEITKDKLSKLIFLEAVIKESLRLYPIGPVLGRAVNEQLNLSKNVSINPGASVAVHIWAINRHKEFWGPDADEFNPERWLGPLTAKEQADLFFSFSQGRRSCIGKSYAMMYLKATLIPILRKFVLTSDHKNVQIEYYITLKIISGHYIQLHLR